MPRIVLPAGGGGGGGNPDVTPGANPARQDLSAGTTVTTVTFNAAAGGTGAFSYGTALSAPPGSTATISAGSGLGPWTLSQMSSGESYVVILTATDTGDGQIANSFALADVGGLGAGSATQVYAAQNARQVTRYKSVISFPVYSVATI